MTEKNVKKVLKKWVDFKSILPLALILIVEGTYYTFFIQVNITDVGALAAIVGLVLSFVLTLTNGVVSSPHTVGLTFPYFRSF